MSLVRRYSASQSRSGRAFRGILRVHRPADVTEFNYRLSGRHRANIFVGISTVSHEDAEALTRKLESDGYLVENLTDNELAKLHARHMVGGHSEEVRDECVYRFQIPERPGALLEFLDKLGGRWNISLFHYRNHGADFGRILAGFEVANHERPDLVRFLDSLGYPSWEETNNPAYQRFLM